MAAISSRASTGLERCIYRALVAKIADRGASLLITGDAGLGRRLCSAQSVTKPVSSIGWSCGPRAHRPKRRCLWPLSTCCSSPQWRTLTGSSPRCGRPWPAHSGFAYTEAPQVYRIALAVPALLAELATRQPVAVIVDDAQWIDRSSAEVLAFVARRVSVDRILVLAATRPHDDDPFV